MSDYYNSPSEKVAADIQRAFDDQAAYDRGPMGSGAIGGSGGGGFSGGGGGGGRISGLTSWSFFFGMLGAVLGGIVGRGIGGALTGALVFAVGFWAVISAIRGVGSGGGAILPWVVKGGLIGVACAVLLFLDEPDKMGIALRNVGIFGAIIGGLARLIQRGR